jgi:hypothetical protein
MSLRVTLLTTPPLLIFLPVYSFRWTLNSSFQRVVWNLTGAIRITESPAQAVRWTWGVLVHTPQGISFHSCSCLRWFYVVSLSWQVVCYPPCVLRASVSFLLCIPVFAFAIWVHLDSWLTFTGYPLWNSPVVLIIIPQLLSMSVYFRDLKVGPYLYFWWDWGLDFRISPLLGRCSATWTTLPVLFCGYFRDRVSQTLCPGWLWTAILLISAFWVARIAGVSHWCPSGLYFLMQWVFLSFWVILSYLIYVYSRYILSFCSILYNCIHWLKSTNTCFGSGGLNLALRLLGTYPTTWATHPPVLKTLLCVMLHALRADCSFFSVIPH